MTRAWFAVLRPFAILVLLVLAGAVPGAAAAPTRPDTITVTSTADSGPGTLRQALLDANGAILAQTIAFNIPPSACDANGICSIHLQSALPTITASMVIDGYTQPGAHPNTLATPYTSDAVVKIDLDGSGAPSLTNGLGISASNCTVRGLSLRLFKGLGAIYAGLANNTIITGNFIGLDPGGTDYTAGNSFDGVRIDYGSGNRVGGPNPADRNVIANNVARGILLYDTTGAIVQGNIIGHRKNGLGMMGNTSSGISIQNGSNNLIGGPNAGEGNVVAWTQQTNVGGIDLFNTNGNTVQGNKVELNSGSGIDLLTASHNTIGGPGALDGNIIVGNSNSLSSSVGGIVIDVLLGDQISEENLVEGNLLGVERTGLVQPNWLGIFVRARNNTIKNNVIRRSVKEGILVVGGWAGNHITNNAIYDNGLLGIDLSSLGNQGDGITPNDLGDPDAGSNMLQNYPLFDTISETAASVQLDGTLNSQPSLKFSLEFFASPACGENGSKRGQVFLGDTAITADASGNASFSVTFPRPPAGWFYFTATATDPVGNTSEFSPCAPLAGLQNTYLPMVRR